ncbi:hypothetical protein GOHSU_38_00460 [Gordonia hirsuta DSM 44140 = NBRC 16056]|uniref:Uncharacterized protein n=1 Tax=Gordonia hirsuta DSM 44140 = NBRC 16056 TaxID=1121927 RepID=L7LEB2_9ACTN|nr:hypothetical protein [Gordonia hirsuta]GAC58407.1 hypothetical protein GOHSU_38_00460 [Gordonia hirsuta DSM 44140 = NBRC 16056]
MITRTNGLLAGVVSLILGAAAHGVAGGFVPDIGQLLILGAIAAGVGTIRSAQKTDSPLAIAAVLVAGQAASHGVLTVIGAHAGHHQVHTAAMLGWHVAAVPAAAVLLCAAAWLLRLVCAQVQLVVAPRYRRIRPAAAARVASLVDVPHHLTPRLSVGMRAPPVAG